MAAKSYPRLRQLPTEHWPPSSPQARWSPDGAQIAFVSDRSGKYELWTMAPDGLGQQQITNVSRQVNDPAWSPDEQKLVFVGCNSLCNLFIVNGDGTSLAQLPLANSGL